MRLPRVRFTVRRMMAAVAVVALSIYACLPISSERAIVIAAESVRARYPGINLSEYDIRVGGPDRWHPCVRFRHKDGRSGLNVILFDHEVYVGVHNDGPPPKVGR
jgi:hypothetical protein